MIIKMTSFYIKIRSLASELDNPTPLQINSLVDSAIFRVIGITVIEDQQAIPEELLEILVLVLVELGLYRAKVHGLRYVVVVVGNLVGRNRRHERPRISVFLYVPQEFLDRGLAVLYVQPFLLFVLYLRGSLGRPSGRPGLLRLVRGAAVWNFNIILDL